VTLECADPSIAHKFLIAVGFVHVVDIVKHRSSYRHVDGVDLSLDDYGSTRILELEILSETQQPGAALDRLRRWAESHLSAELRELREPYVLSVIRNALRGGP
jgi:adenylate cyclase class IV